MFKQLRKTLMMLGECFSMSLSNILNNRVRSFLTVLGILIGVTAVIALITTVSGFSGTNFYYFYLNADALKRGRPIHPTDEESMTFVCLISQTIVDELFFGVDPVGESMFIDGVPFTVIGLLSDSTSGSIASLMSGSADIIFPYTTALKLNNANVVTSFTVSLTEGSDSGKASSAITEVMDAMFSCRPRATVSALR